MVDTVPSESERARHVSQQVDEFLARKRSPETLRAAFLAWRDEEPPLDNGLLAELAPVAQDVKALAAAALEALDLIAAGHHAGAAWSAKQKTLLDSVSKPRAELLISIVEPVRKLVTAAQ
jgi:hypothetical protein